MKKVKKEKKDRPSHLYIEGYRLDESTGRMVPVKIKIKSESQDD